MIAVTLPRRQRKLAKKRADELFLKMLPAIRRRASSAFEKFHADEREELAAEVVANAYCASAR